MKSLYELAKISGVCIPLLFFSCGKDYVTTIRGTVLKENYTSATSPAFLDPGTESTYCFQMETIRGNRVIQVKSDEIAFDHIDKETLDAIIDIGTKVEVEIKRSDLDKEIYNVLANRIKVIN